jgi:dTMP kinase
MNIRRILLDPANCNLSPQAEMLLMFASRAQALAEVITPALARGSIVVSDRFTDSTLAYQGEARGLGFAVVRGLHQLAVGNLLPDLTLCIEVDVAEGLDRARLRNAQHVASGDSCTVARESRIDEQPLEFHQRVLSGYRKIAHEEPERFRLVDGSGSVEAVAERVWAIVEPRLGRAGE